MHPAAALGGSGSSGSFRCSARCLHRFYSAFLAAQNRRNPDSLVRENSRWAANWVITVTLVAAIGSALVMFDTIAGLVVAGANENGTTPLLLVANLLLWAAVIGHLVVSIVGVARARTRIVNPKIAIPFIPAAK